MYQFVKNGRERKRERDNVDTKGYKKPYRNNTFFFPHSIRYSETATEGRKLFDKLLE